MLTFGLFNVNLDLFQTSLAQKSAFGLFPQIQTIVGVLTSILLSFSHRTNLIPSAVLAPEIPEIYLLEIGFGE